MKSFLFSVVLCCISLSLAAQVSKTINVIAGGVSSALTAHEKSSVTNLTVTGTINASDFKTLRDELPKLEVIDISGAKIAAYTGTGGTGGGRNISYPAEEIPVAAFYSSAGSKLTTVVLNPQTTAIGANAFNGCSLLTSINFPSKLTSFGNGAFSGCIMLSNIIFPAQLENIGTYAFLNCSQISGDIVLPLSIKSIGKRAFGGCSAINSVEIKGSITTIADSCFANCTNLVSAILPNTVTSIGNCAFINCKALKINSFPASLASIGQYAFFYCIDIIENLVLPSTLTTLGKGCFSNCTRIRRVELPNSLTSIADSIFSNCTLLSSVIFPDQITSIGNYAFKFCSSLEGELTIKPSVVSIGKYAFSHCGFSKVTLSSSLTELPEGFLYSCDKLNSIILPQSIKKIGAYSFFGCYKMNDLFIPQQVQEIGLLAFNSSGIKIEVDGNNEFFASKDGVLYNKSFTKIIFCPKTFKGNFTVPIGVTVVSESAFSYCWTITSITLPSSLIEVEERAFFGTGITQIVIPENTKIIGDFAFSGCGNLKSVYLPPELIKIGNFAFEISGLEVFLIDPTPVDLTGNFEPFRFSGSTLYVPEENISLYKNLNEWKRFLIKPLPKVKLINDQIVVADTVRSQVAAFVVSSGTWVPLSNQKWLSVSPNIATTGSCYVTVEAEVNYGEERNGEIVFFSSTGSDTLYVTQKANSKTYFSTQELHLNAGGNSTATIDVVTLGSWIASSDQEWLTVSPNSLYTGSGPLIVTTTQNTGDERKAYITVISSVGTIDTIAVVQEAGNVGREEIAIVSPKIYPNPFSSSITIVGLKEIADFRLTDVLGRSWISATISENDCLISTAGLPYGLFIAKIITREGTIKKRILKK